MEGSEGQESPSSSPSTIQPRHGDQEIDRRALLQALPTRADLQTLPTHADMEVFVSRVEEVMEALVTRVEETHRKYLEAVRGNIQILTDKLNNEMVERFRKSYYALRQTQYPSMTNGIQLKLEEIEDRSRRKSLRFRGIPETFERKRLQETIHAICLQLTVTPLPQTLEFERIHRSLGPRSVNEDRPRDVICCFHRYSDKEIISRVSWEAGEIKYEGSQIKILPDLSRATLQRRAMLRPLLDKIRKCGGSYRWGYPFSLTIKKNLKSFSLKQSDLPELFKILEVEPVEVPDWLQYISSSTNRTINPVTTRSGPAQRKEGGRRPGPPMVIER